MEEPEPGLNSCRVLTQPSLLLGGLSSCHAGNFAFKTKTLPSLPLSGNSSHCHCCCTTWLAGDEEEINTDLKQGQIRRARTGLVGKEDRNRGLGGRWNRNVEFARWLWCPLVAFPRSWTLGPHGHTVDVYLPRLPELCPCHFLWQWTVRGVIRISGLGESFWTQCARPYISLCSRNICENGCFSSLDPWVTATSRDPCQTMMDMWDDGEINFVA